ncbi:hypothetical protein Taro_000589 [Colocasia esculenta]|uniref:Glycosyltransferase family 92 protein n=1 Tax=Colocasia esculenta TaxID=4460 RepID=A0A843TDE9_COLES|nr:hypothetical protein [Colocasia esculenta]
MRKDGVAGGGAGGGAAGSPPFSCLDVKPFVATLVALTLVMAIWQLQPYESLLSPRTCPLPNPSPAATTIAAAANPASKQNLSASLKASPSDPHKRVFRSYGSAAALFVQMGAYRGGPSTFAVIGLASKPAHVYGKPWFKCEWASYNPNATTVRAKAYKILPDWGYGRVYTVVVVNCTFPTNPNTDNLGGKLLLYAYYSSSPRRYEKFVALEEAPGSYDESRFRPPYPYDYLYCGSSLYGNLSAHRVREWMAYHAHFFGPRSHFVFHDAGGIGAEVRKVLEPWVRAGRATVQDIRAQEEYDGYYYNQFLVVNDCLHRYRHAAKWTFFFDVDEYIYLPGGNTLEAVLAEFENYTQFTIEQNPMSSKLCVREPSRNYSRFSRVHYKYKSRRLAGSLCIFGSREKARVLRWEWGFEKLVFRNSITGIRRDRKYAIRAKNAFATGVHMSENVIGKALHKTETKIRYYHYHDSINILGEPCREFVPMPAKGNLTWFEKIPYDYDDNLKRIADTIKLFEQQTIGVIQV